MPALAFDLGDVADRDVADADPGVSLDVVDVGQLRLDGVGARAAALGARQRQASSSRANCAAGHAERDDQEPPAARGAAGATRITDPGSRRHHHARRPSARVGRPRPRRGDLPGTGGSGAVGGGPGAGAPCGGT